MLDKYIKTIKKYIIEIDNDFCNLEQENFNNKIINTIVPSLKKLNLKISGTEKKYNDCIISCLLDFTIEYNTQYNRIDTIQKSILNIYRNLDRA
ncbi:MAG: hypothetical protein ACRCYT_01200 [Cetobacterium sp.]